MRHLALIVLAVLWVTPAQAETKEGPDGFGPIKFGMTKEEAWAAIDGKGDWSDEGSLDYQLKSVGILDYSFEVSQFFSKGLATYSIAGRTQINATRSRCLRHLFLLVSIIADVYDREPMQFEDPKFQSPGSVEAKYLFGFRDGSFIEIDHEVSERSEAKADCIVQIAYSPPNSSEDAEKVVDGVL